MPQKFPLDWPVGYARTKKPRRSKFVNPTLGKTVGNIIEEIVRLNNNGHVSRIKIKDNIFISTNIPLRNDGMPRADYYRSNVEDKGVAVYFKKGDQDVVLCCDKWDSVEQNLHAIYKTIEAIRSVERWGVSDFIEKSFAGFTALPAAEPWYSVLGFGRHPSNFAQVQPVYRHLVKQCHPDADGGSTEKFQRLQQAYEEAKRYFGV